MLSHKHSTLLTLTITICAGLVLFTYLAVQYSGFFSDTAATQVNDTDSTATSDELTQPVDPIDVVRATNVATPTHPARKQAIVATLFATSTNEMSSEQKQQVLEQLE